MNASRLTAVLVAPHPAHCASVHGLELCFITFWKRAGFACPPPAGGHLDTLGVSGAILVIYEDDHQQSRDHSKQYYNSAAVTGYARHGSPGLYILWLALSGAALKLTHKAHY